MKEILERIDRNPTSVSLKEILRSAEMLQLDLHGRRANPVDFLRTPKLSEKELELTLRSRLSWLKTIPLSAEETFIVLHEESGVYMQREDGTPQIRKAGLCSADLIGLHRRGSAPAQFTVAELKYGKDSNNLLYAFTEGLRNLYLHLQGYSRITDGWEKAATKKTAWSNREQNAWSKKADQNWQLGNPFKHNISESRASVLVVGDYEWAHTAKNSKAAPNTDLLPLIPETVVLGEWTVDVSVYVTPKGVVSTSAPYELLPLIKLK